MSRFLDCVATLLFLVAVAIIALIELPFFAVEQLRRLR